MQSESYNAVDHFTCSYAHMYISLDLHVVQVQQALITIFVLYMLLYTTGTVVCKTHFLWDNKVSYLLRFELGSLVDARRLC